VTAAGEASRSRYSPVLPSAALDETRTIPSSRSASAAKVRLSIAKGSTKPSL
jgi:hypothetical protein